MPDKQQIITSLTAIAKRLGRAPSEREFNSFSGISTYYVLQFFRSWNDALRAARLRPYTLNVRAENRALLEDWGKVVRKVRGAPTRRAYTRVGRYNFGTIEKRFGPWSRLPEAFRNFARGKPRWNDVVALLPSPPRCGPAPKDQRHVPNEIASSTVPPAKTWHCQRKDRPMYGHPTPFRWLRHEPLNEQGVVLLFGMLAKDLGYLVESVQKGFPDCEAKRQVGPERWQRVFIEFEFESKNFRDHGHPEHGCDMIVCWRHNWEECPKHIEVLELSSVIKSPVGSEGRS
ncbi:MAG TPA: hypothetical protein VE077_15370 [Candidatus Methylomirabilis sp.]|nr:hypothetical protein [Candidatus Methylomirabilis sp.]